MNKKFKKIIERIINDTIYILIAGILGVIIPQITTNKQSVDGINNSGIEIGSITGNLQFYIENEIFLWLYITTLFIALLFIYRYSKSILKISIYLSNIFLGFTILGIFIFSMNFEIEDKLKLEDIALNYISSIIFYIFYILGDKIYIKKCKKKKKLFLGRREQTKLLDMFFDRTDIKTIFVDGEWGIGKTFFIENFLAEKKNKIYIDVLLEMDKNRIMLTFLSEIKRILKRNQTLVFSISDLERYFEVIDENFPLKIKGIFNFNSKNKEQIKEKYNSLLENLDEEIILVVDNLDRLLSKESLVKILGFLHEIEKFRKIKIIVLGDLKVLTQILKKNIEAEEKLYLDKYLDKFFLNRIILKTTEYYEILEKNLIPTMSPEATNKLIKNINEKNEKIGKIGADLKGMDKDHPHKIKWKEVEELALLLKKLLGNPRDVEKLVEEYKKFEKKYNVLLQNIKNREEKLFLLLAIREINKNILDKINIGLKKWDEVTIDGKKIPMKFDPQKTKEELFLGIFLSLENSDDNEIMMFKYLSKEPEIDDLEKMKKTFLERLEKNLLDWDRIIKDITILKEIDRNVITELYQESLKYFPIFFNKENNNIENLFSKNLFLLDLEFYHKKKETIIDNLIQLVGINKNINLKILDTLDSYILEIVKTIFVPFSYKTLVLNSNINLECPFARIKKFLFEYKALNKNIRIIEQDIYGWEEKYLKKLLEDKPHLKEKPLGSLINYFSKLKELEEKIEYNNNIIGINLTKESMEERIFKISENIDIKKINNKIQNDNKKCLFDILNNISEFRKVAQKKLKEKGINEIYFYSLNGFKEARENYYKIRRYLEVNKLKIKTLEDWMKGKANNKIETFEDLKNEMIELNLFSTYENYFFPASLDSANLPSFENLIKKIKFTRFISRIIDPFEERLQENDIFFMKQDWNSISSFLEEDNIKSIFNNYLISSKTNDNSIDYDIKIILEKYIKYDEFKKKYNKKIDRIIETITTKNMNSELHGEYLVYKSVLDEKLANLGHVETIEYLNTYGE